MNLSKNIFGSVHHSLFHLVKVLDLFFPDLQVSIVSPDKKLKKGAVYLLNDLQLLQKHAQKLQGQKAAVIVCESFPRLKQIVGVKYLDGTVEFGTYYPSEQKLTKTRLNAVSESLTEPLKIVLQQKVEILPELIESTRSGKFLDKFNALLYFGLSQGEQYRVRIEIMKYLYDNKSRKSLQDFLAGIFSTSKGQDCVNQMFRFLDSDPGVKLRNATLDLGKAFKSKKPVPLEQIVKKHRADSSELAYLNKLYQTLKDKNATGR